MRTILKILFGSTINIIEYHSGDVLVFCVNEEVEKPDLDWISQTLKKYLKTNIEFIFVKGIFLTNIIRRKSK